MKIFRQTAFAAAVGALLISISPAQAQQQQRPPKPDLAKMAESMGVTEDALKSCMGKPPEGKSSQGGRPPRPDAAKISACLQDAGEDVTEESVSETLQSFAPKRRSR